MADFVEVKKRMSEIKDQYSTKKDKVNILLMGGIGAGKTHFLSTCKKPILVHSFDPGGTRVTALQPMIAKGEIIVDTQFESDRSATPTAWRDWEAEYRTLKKAGVFDHIGTYCIDSITKASIALMNGVLKKVNNPDNVASPREYLVQQNTLTDALSDVCNLPCNTIVTGHIGMMKDEVTGKLHSGLFMSGKLVIKIPLLYDEIWVLTRQASSKGTTFKLLTTTDGTYEARTRIGGGGIFKMYEVPNCKQLLDKAGYDTEDLPAITD